MEETEEVKRLEEREGMRQANKMAAKSKIIWRCRECGKSFEKYITGHYSEYPGAPMTSEYGMCPYCGSGDFDDRGEESEVKQ